MKPDIYLGGEEQDYLKYRQPKKFEHFLSGKSFLIMLALLVIMLSIAEVVS